MSTTPQPSDFRFETTDAFGWNRFAAHLEAFLLTEAEFVDGSLVASLNAPFGSGKTTFLRMWKDQLDSRRKSDPSIPMCILLNAWEDDYCGDPLLALVDAIEQELSERTSDEKTKNCLGSVKEATRDLSWFMVGMANSAVSHWTGLNAAAAGEFAETKKANRKKEQPIPDILTLFQSRKGALQRLKSALQSLFHDNSKPVFVLVDELDRCRPDFAVQYLETIKHVFDVEGLSFVLAVDLPQLENSARALFGNNLNFPEYYRKFAHRNICLPTPDKAGIQNLVTKYITRYLDDSASESPRRRSLLNFDNTRRALTELPYDFRLIPRQIQEAFRILGHMTSVREKNTGDLYYHISNPVIFLTFLSLGKPALFHEFLSENLSLDRMVEIVSKLPISKDLVWWAFVLALSLDADDEKLKAEDIHKAFIKYGIVSNETTVEDVRKRWGGFSSGGIAGRLSLANLARRIQEVEKFDQ